MPQKEEDYRTCISSIQSACYNFNMPFKQTQGTGTSTLDSGPMSTKQMPKKAVKFTAEDAERLMNVLSDSMNELMLCNNICSMINIIK